MAKYNYDKSILKGLSVSPFLNEVKVRNEAIESTEDTDIHSSVYQANTLASRLHPASQKVVISDIEELPGAKAYTLKMAEDASADHPAYFRAGQYVSVPVVVEGHTLHLPYTLSSSPKEAMAGTYRLTIKENPKGEASKAILNTWKAGDTMEISGPLGEFYYTKLRDADHVAALAGGSGITPFLSMAKAIADGTEQFKLTIFYGCKREEEILHKEELDELAKHPDIDVVYVLSDQEKDGYEHGFVSADLIQKHMKEKDFSVFVCGPPAMLKFEKSELRKLDLPNRRIRFEVPGELPHPSMDPAWPEPIEKSFKMTVRFQNGSYHIECRPEWTLLNAIERAGLQAPSHCRSGQCGWCHSRLVQGLVFIPSDRDGRREADRKFGWIHPCAAYPLSDIILEVPDFSRRKRPGENSEQS